MLTPLLLLDTAPYFAPLHAELIALLRSLSAHDWEKPTVAGAWRVREVAAHLLDGDLRTLAAHRDGHGPSTDGPPLTYAEVVQLIQRLNVDGVAFGARLSPQLLTDLLEVTGRWMSAFVTALDPDALAIFPVSWAGEVQSTNRFDTAREYTERWHHQMQIRDAIGAPGAAARLLASPFFRPLLETSVRVLPHAYRAVSAADATSLTVGLLDDPASRWTLLRANGAWTLYAGEAASPSARVYGAPDSWWRLFFNALPLTTVVDAFERDGPDALVSPLWRARAVMV